MLFLSTKFILLVAGGSSGTATHQEMSLFSLLFSHIKDREGGRKKCHSLDRLDMLTLL